MRFKGHAKLIDKCYIMTRVELNTNAEGTAAFFMMRDAITTPSLRELIDRAALQLSKAGLEGEHMVSFDLVVHAQEIDEE